ncbi:MAG: hypothetical protein RR603_01920 [Kurthia sp.]
MRPVLTVEGKQAEIFALYYRDNKIHSVTVIDDYGVTKNYHDIKENTQYYTEKPLQVDFEKALKWVGRYDEIYETIDKAITDKGLELLELAVENIETKQPFTPNEIQQKYFYMQREQVGLIDAQEIVHGFMVDDVDLSGGGSNE